MEFEPFPKIMARARGGDQEAANEIFRRYVRQLIALASRHFRGPYRTKADAEDMVQSAYASFVRADGRLPFDLEDWDSFWKLLALFTVRKCARHREHWKAGKRSIDRERISAEGSEGDHFHEAVGREPTPHEATILNETLDILRHDLSDRDRRIFEMTLEGYTQPEVAGSCGCSGRTVARTLERVKSRLSSMTPEPAGVGRA